MTVRRIYGGVLVVVAAGGLVLAGCGGGGDDAEAARERCLFAAVNVYPALPADKIALDEAEPCRGLPESDKALLRQMMTAFVESANAKINAAG